MTPKLVIYKSYAMKSFGKWVWELRRGRGILACGNPKGYRSKYKAREAAADVFCLVLDVDYQVVVEP